MGPPGTARLSTLPPPNRGGDKGRSARGGSTTQHVHADDAPVALHAALGASRDDQSTLIHPSKHIYTPFHRFAAGFPAVKPMVSPLWVQLTCVNSPLQRTGRETDLAPRQVLRHDAALQIFTA